MKPYSELTREELLALKAELEAAFEDVKGKGLKLDMSRGKPATVQLDMTEGLLGIVSQMTKCIRKTVRTAGITGC